MIRIRTMLLFAFAVSVFFSCSTEEAEPTINVDFTVELTYPDSCRITLTNKSSNYKKMVSWEYLDYYVDRDTIRQHYLPYGEEVSNWVIIGGGENVKDATVGIFIEDNNGIIHHERKAIPISLVESCNASWKN